MLRGFWRLSWVEVKIFAREPLGVIGTLGLPVVVFLLFGGVLSGGGSGNPAQQAPFNVAIFAALLLSVSAVTSLVAIMSIYREGGILKRLRATPLSPLTILSAHVFVKLGFTLVGLTVLVLAGRRMLPDRMDGDLIGFAIALLVSTLSILSLGFLIASVVPTARLAQPISAAILYPMIILSGLFFPVDRLPMGLATVAHVLPMTHAVTLMQGVWEGSGWHGGSILALFLIFAVCTALASSVFRWE
jgi:ABC-2 type transport system permease protein